MNPPMADSAADQVREEVETEHAGRVPIGGGVAECVLIPVQAILDGVHGHPCAVDRIIEASFREVDIQDRVIDV